MAQELERIIQESVPGKQVTIAHVIASPMSDIYDRLGIDEALKEKGVQEGESVRIRDMVFEYKDNN